MDMPPDSHDGFDLLPKARSDIAQMSRKAQESVLSPADPGAWSIDWRHAVAARICRLHGIGGLEAGYLAKVADPAVAGLADPAHKGRTTAETVVLAFMDRVATTPREIVAGDITALTDAGVAEPDVVRLCEMAAFLAYQCRVAAGLALIAGGVQ